VLAGRREAEIADAAIISAQGGQAVAVPADVSRAGDVQRLVEATIDRFGRLDVAFNNAGIEGVFEPAHLMSEKDFDEVISINLERDDI